MPEDVSGWLAQGGGAATSLVALLHGGVLGGLALLLVVLTFSIKTAGPELRQWVTMLCARSDAKKLELVQSTESSRDHRG